MSQWHDVPLAHFGSAAKMKFSYSTNAFGHFPLPVALRHIKEIGYEGVEIVADEHPGLLEEGPLQEDLIKTLSSLPLSVSNVNANTARKPYAHSVTTDTCYLSSVDDALRQGRILYTKMAIDLAALVAAPCVSITSGPPPDDPSDIPRARRCFLESLAEILPHARQNQIRVGIEYEPGFLAGCARDVMEILQELGDGALGANLDLGHAAVAGEDPSEIVRFFADRILNIHIEDIRGRRHHHLIPGQGDMDFRSIFKAIEEVHYEAFLTVELYTFRDAPVDAGRKALAFLTGGLSSAQSG